MSSTSRMKILALPIARIGPPGTAPLIYHHTHLPSLDRDPSGPSASQEAKHPLRKFIEGKLGLVPNAPVALQITTKATDVWADLGHGKKGGWKERAHTFGEREMDRIEFEEWSLKSIEKELVPKALMKGFGAQIETSRANPVKKDEQVEPKTSAGPGASKGGYAVAKPEKVLLSFPKVNPPLDALASLSDFAQARIPMHNSKIKMWFLASPLTIPFGLIPIMPNFAFFFVAWRAWSHWKARNAARILDHLIKTDRIEAAPSNMLTTLYAGTQPRAVGQGEVYLTESMVDHIVARESLGEAGHDELMRAIGQAQLRLEKLAKSSPSTVGEHVEQKAKEHDPTTSPIEEAKKEKNQ